MKFYENYMYVTCGGVGRTVEALRWGPGERWSEAMRRGSWTPKGGGHNPVEGGGGPPNNWLIWWGFCDISTWATERWGQNPPRDPPQKGPPPPYPPPSPKTPEFLLGAVAAFAAPYGMYRGCACSGVSTPTLTQPLRYHVTKYPNQRLLAISSLMPTLLSICI